MPPTPEQVWQLLDKAEELAASDPLAAMGRSAIFIDSLTGLRPSELLALQYADIHWDPGEILIRQSITKVNATDGVHKWRWEIGLPKNDKERRVALPPMVADLLRSLRKTAQDRDGYVFTPAMFGLKHPSYQFLDPDYLDASVFAPIAEAARLAGHRFHDVRHFFASMLIAQGESAKYVCDQMATAQSRSPMTPMVTCSRPPGTRRRPSYKPECSRPAAARMMRGSLVFQVEMPSRVVPGGFGRKAGRNEAISGQKSIRLKAW